eukprot:s3291_g4.t1
MGLVTRTLQIDVLGPTQQYFCSERPLHRRDRRVGSFALPKMARRSGIALLIVAALCVAPTFVAPRSQPAPVEVDTARVAAIAAGLTPLALEQPASAYDSVVAMLQSHLEVGGIALVLIYGAAFVAALANPLTKRRQEVKAEVDAMKRA